METADVNDKQAMEICENIGRTLVDLLDTEEVWNKVEQVLAEYLKSNKINADATDLADRVEWAVKVKLRK